MNGQPTGGGWVKLHREILEHRDFQNGEWLKLWVWMLLKATHKPFPYRFNGSPIILQPGQFVTCRKDMAREVRLHESSIQRLIKRMKTEQQIEQLTGNASSLFTIVNWNHYQQIEQPIEQPANSQRTASEQPANYKQEQKNKRTKEDDCQTFDALPPAAQQKPEPSSEKGFSEFPSEDEVVAFAKAWPGDMARAIPAAIDEAWALRHYAYAWLGERSPKPKDWKRFMVNQWISDALKTRGQIKGKSNANNQQVQHIPEKRVSRNIGTANEGRAAMYGELAKRIEAERRAAWGVAEEVQIPNPPGPAT